MRLRSYSLIVLALFVILAAAPVFAQDKPAAPAAGTDPAKVEAFLKSLGDAMSVDNHMRVASFVKYPLEAWVGGEKLTVRSDSQLFAHYREIFDKSLQQSLASVSPGSFTTDAQGVTACDGRIVVAQVSAKNNALKIVKIGEPAAR